jgi:radical SAM protein with 4Fe4S-binding SPASM domain
MFPTPGGNIREHPVDEIWRRSRVFDRIRRTTTTDMTECPTCEVRQHCAPCMAYGEIEAGDHRACNSTSKNSALALREPATRRERAEGKMAKGRALPLVGELTAPKPSDPSVVSSGEEFL